MKIINKTIEKEIKHWGEKVTLSVRFNLEDYLFAFTAWITYKNGSCESFPIHNISEYFPEFEKYLGINKEIALSCLSKIKHTEIHIGVINVNGITRHLKV
jgi:hypothetical protein